MARQLNPMTSNTPTPTEWRAAMGYFPTGVTVVTSWRDREPVGSTINAMCSVSLDPPMLLICLNHSNPLSGPVRRCGVFGINILGEEDQSLARHFATAPENERFKTLGFRTISGGAPQLDAAPVFIDCVVECVHEAGDHIILVARGVRTDIASNAPPLLYHRGAYSKMPETA